MFCEIVKFTLICSRLFAVCLHNINSLLFMDSNDTYFFVRFCLYVYVCDCCGISAIKKISDNNYCTTFVNI